MLYLLKKLAYAAGFDVQTIGGPKLSRLFKRDRCGSALYDNLLAGLVLKAVIENFDFATVLDIGSGEGRHAEVFLRHGKQVTAVDLGRSIYFRAKAENLKTITGDYLEKEFAEQFDLIWASHVLEHQPNPNLFLKKIYRDLKEGGILAITVPPFKHDIVGGHVTLWNGGLLMYHLVLAGFHCRDISIRQYGYNISAILTKKSICLPELDHDAGDIDRLSSFFPEGFREGSNGFIDTLNWRF